MTITDLESEPVVASAAIGPAESPTEAGQSTVQMGLLATAIIGAGTAVILTATNNWDHAGEVGKYIVEAGQFVFQHAPGVIDTLKDFTFSHHAMTAGAIGGTLAMYAERNRTAGLPITQRAVPAIEGAIAGFGGTFLVQHRELVWQFLDFVGNKPWLIGGALSLATDITRTVHQEHSLGLFTRRHLLRKLGYTVSGIAGGIALQNSHSTSPLENLINGAVPATLGLATTELGLAASHLRKQNKQQGEVIAWQGDKLGRIEQVMRE